MELDDMKKARLLVNCVMNSNPKNPQSYIAAAKLEEFSGRIVNARLLIQAGREECPNNHDLIVESRRLARIPLMRGRENQDGWVTSAVKIWLTDAKQNGLSGNLSLARKIIRAACAAVPDSEELWLAAFKLEFDNHKLERASAILAIARGGECGTERVWLKSAIVERELGETAGERKLLREGLGRFPSFFKLWLMLGQLEERIGNLPQAKAAYQSGLARCPKSVPLWVSLADVAEKSCWRVGFGEWREGERRAILAMSLKINPKSPELWLAAIRAEIRLGNKEEADILMAKGLEKCPKSGILWAASIKMAPRPQRKTKVTDAYKKCNKDGHVLAAVGKLFWEDGKVEKARNWLNRAVVTIAPYIGDFWAIYYKFEIENGSDENQKEVLKRCVAAGPKHGEKWQVVSKAVRNSRQPTEAILKKVCLLLERDQEISSILVLDL